MIEVRVRFGKGARKRFDVATEARAAVLRAMARELAAAEVDPKRGEQILDDAAKASDGELSVLRQLVAQLASGTVKANPKTASGYGVTFQELAERWVSGELHKSYPDHVKLKQTANLDSGRLDALYKTIGSVRLDAFKLEDAERAMAALPKAASSSATRRQYAQLISKVLKLAVYPCRIIERSPLPLGFLPTVRNLRVTSYLYPDEDAALLSCRRVPLESRMLWGFLAREGLRIGEALGLRWRDVDLVRGVITLDVNKTDDPRAWALSTGVAEALLAHRPQEAGPDWLIFPNPVIGHPAEAFREHLERAGVNRPELTASSSVRRPIRVHDLRATFVTLSLANGRSEAWVADRTGHRSSVMINKYRRQARQALELGFKPLQRLDAAVPEIGERIAAAAGPAISSSLGQTLGQHCGTENPKNDESSRIAAAPQWRRKQELAARGSEPREAGRTVATQAA